jgi:hypothetical protein
VASAVVKEEDSASPTVAIAIIVYVTLIFVFCMVSRSLYMQIYKKVFRSYNIFLSPSGYSKLVFL